MTGLEINKKEKSIFITPKSLKSIDLKLLEK